jgi:hypothetical protein
MEVSFLVPNPYTHYGHGCLGEYPVSQTSAFLSEMQLAGIQEIQEVSCFEEGIQTNA